MILFRLMVGWFVGLHENYRTDLQETSMDDEPRPRKDLINFLCGSGQKNRYRIFFLLSTFSSITVGTMHRS